MASYEHDKANLQVRLRRIEGQVRGLQRMIDEDKYCVDVLTQVASVIAALQKVGVIVLEDHIRGCVRTALAEGQAGDKAVEELLAVVERFVKAGPVTGLPTLADEAPVDAGSGMLGSMVTGSAMPGSSMSGAAGTGRT